MTRWVRLWEDMPTDPKWRVIARRSGRPLAEVLAVFVFMMTRCEASTGSLDGWDDEDVAAALDTDPEAVAAIRDAMQGKTLDGESLTGWERRQPKRHDDHSTERVKAFRDRQRADETHVKRTETRTETQCNAPEEKREETEKKERAPRKRATTIPDDFPSAEVRAWASTNYPSMHCEPEWRRARDWALKEGKTYKDWDAFGRNWIDRAAEYKGVARAADSTVVAIRTGFHAMRGSPQWEAWDRHYRQTTGRGPPEGKAGGWHFPSEYPPTTEQAASA